MEVTQIIYISYEIIFLYSNIDILMETKPTLFMDICIRCVPS